MLSLLRRRLGRWRGLHRRQVAGAAAVGAAREAAQVVGARLVHQQARRLERNLVLHQHTAIKYTAATDLS